MGFSCVNLTALIFFILSERKLASGEFPHNLYIQNYSTSSATCISLRRWLFSPAKEKQLMEDAIALDFFFWQVSIFFISFPNVSGPGKNLPN